MANCKSAKKRIRQTKTRTARNVERKSRIRTFIKKFLIAVRSAEDSSAVQAAFVAAQSEIQRGVTKGVLHKNTASRKVSRLNRILKTVVQN